MRRDPFKLPGIGRALPSLSASLKQGLKKPPLGFTQGGSSRKHSGARVAARDGSHNPRDVIKF